MPYERHDDGSVTSWHTDAPAPVKQGYEAIVVLDSLNAYTGAHRLTTMQLTYPRFVHSEFMTHRMFSRNSASSRAIPVEKMLSRVMCDPVVPIEWGKNQKGMQARDVLSADEAVDAERVWFAARLQAVEHARKLLAIGVHKQIVNRLLEPWLYHTTLVTGTSDAWANFFHLRCHPDAQPEIQRAAYLARDAYRASDPLPRATHMPLLRPEDAHDVEALCEHTRQLVTTLLRQISAARCARVSYLTHNGVRDISEDLRLFDRLVTSGHWSPLEHVATALGPHDTDNGLANFDSWRQLRKEYPREYVATL